jgi:hypothetical protein
MPSTGTLEDIVLIVDAMNVPGMAATSTGATSTSMGSVMIRNISINGEMAMHAMGMNGIAFAKSDCRNGGFALFGFRSMGECVAAAGIGLSAMAPMGTAFGSDSFSRFGAPNIPNTGTNGTGGGTSTTSSPAAFDYGPAFSQNMQVGAGNNGATQNGATGATNSSLNSGTTNTATDGTSGTTTMDGQSGTTNTSGSGTTTNGATGNQSGTQNTSASGASTQGNPNGSFSASGYTPM